jgi:hypothetical protein
MLDKLMQAIVVVLGILLGQLLAGKLFWKIPSL